MDKMRDLGSALVAAGPYPRYSTIEVLMRNAIRQIGVLAAVVAAGTVLSSTGAAQSAREIPGGPEQLEAKATHPNTLADHWLDSGDLLVQAARLRPAADPRALDDLIGAAEAYRVAGEPMLARWAALDAAGRSLRANDADHAAHAYLAAAVLSADVHEVDAALTYLERAERLAASPRLTGAQKSTILAQVQKARSAQARD